MDPRTELLCGIWGFGDFKISVGDIPNSKEVCIFEVDINYHFFFALAVDMGDLGISKKRLIIRPKNREVTKWNIFS